MTRVKQTKRHKKLAKLISNNRRTVFTSLTEFESAMDKMIKHGFTFDDLHEILKIYEHGTGPM